MYKIILYFFFILLCFPLLGFSAVIKNDNDKVFNYVRPEICMAQKYRCVLRQGGSMVYWCVKTQRQRTLDTRYPPKYNIGRTRKNIQGNCSKIIYIEKTR